MTSRSRRSAVATAGIVALAGLLLACTPGVGTVAVRQRPNVAQVFDNADPAVLVDAGRTYLFGSSNNTRVPVRIISSFGASLESSKYDWDRNPRDAMPSRPAWVDPGESDIWAPSVIKIGNQFVMYFAAHNVAATTDEANDQCIGRSFASNPMGPYAPEGGPIYCGLTPEGSGHGLPASNRFGRGVLDPEVFRAANGALYMVAAFSRTGANIGSVALTSDGRVVGGLNAAPGVLANQSMPWHDGTDDGTSNGGFLENPTMVYEPNTRSYLLFYSAGDWYSDRYNTSFSRCASPTGPCTQDTRGPFLVGGNGRVGPGGMTIFRAPDGGLKVAYASWEQDRTSGYPNPIGIYSRRTHWANLQVGATPDPAQQFIALG